MIFVPSLERLASVEDDDFTELLAIRREWSEIFAEDFVHFDTFYALIIEAGQTLLGVEQSCAHSHVFTQKAAEVFLYTASDTDYLRAIGSKPAIEARLAQHHETILSLIVQMTAAAKGREELARPVDALISLYFHHTAASDVAEGLRADVARVIPDALMAFPEQSFSFAIYLLAQGSDAAKHIGRIMTFHVVERGDVAHNICQEVGEGMMGLTMRRERLVELGAAIMGPVARATRDKRPEICDDLVAAFVLSPLQCNPRSREAQIARLEADLSFLRVRLSSFEKQHKAPVPVTAQDTSLVLDISQAERELKRAKDDFEGWMDERWNIAVHQIATQPYKRATLEAIQTGLSPYQSVELEQLLSDAARANL